MRNTLKTTVVEEADKRKGKGKYWYYITVYECVLCGRYEEYRERRYDEKPDGWGDRHKFIEMACDLHY